MPEHRASNAVQALESCNSTWLFDADRSRFRRVPKGTSIDVPAPPEEWQRYYSLELDADTGAFVVTLNQNGTRSSLLPAQGALPHCDATHHELSLERCATAGPDPTTPLNVPTSARGNTAA